MAKTCQRPYGVRVKSAAAILFVVKRFVADMGVPRAFRTDNDTGVRSKGWSHEPGVVVSAERAWDPHICHEAFHDRKNGGRALLAYPVWPL